MKDLPAGTLILIIVLSLLLLAVIVISIRAFAEPFILKVTHRKMFPAGNNDGFKRQDGSSAPSGSTPGLRLFFFTDLHADICRISSSKLISAIRDAHASSPIDAVVFGGDICNRKKINLKGLAYLEEISAACKELGISFYGVTGNHDIRYDPSEQKCPFICIENEQIAFTSHATGKTVILCGVDDSGRRERVWYKVPSVPSDSACVLVAHNPDAILHFDEDEHVDFMLSGHFHAGQVKMPFRLEFLVLRSDHLPQQGVIEGIFEHRGTTLFISRGLGCNKLPIRLGALPEASVVEIYV